MASITSPRQFSLVRDVSLSALVAGFITVLVGYTSSAAIVFQAARSLGANPAEIASWMWALGIGMGITCLVPSLWLRLPVVTAWSTPGAAMLAGSALGLPMSEVIGAFMLSALMITFAGYTGWFEKVMNRVPMALASGMLAGILLRFGIDAFAAVQTQPQLVLAMLATYLAGRVWFSRYAIIATFTVGIVLAAHGGMLQMEGLQWQWPQPVMTWPSLSVSGFFSIALPLFIVTMASQNIPGVIVAKSMGYQLPVSPIIGFIGIVNLALAPFGGYAFNLAAITAAICMGREAHENPQRRYVAAMAAGCFYLLAGLLGGAVVALFAGLPKELIMAIAGIAVLGTIANSLLTALHEEGSREPALIAFLVTASGLSLAGIGSAFWGLAAGGMAMLVFKLKRG
ncbi:benzoate/H(+) symporter BenE family transporter [Lampropedia aestuarii]|uniref:Benzoate/H(+) symporter BenE family transporter n=1 Tax=Lampropedia aestuarii TaxID=2562762 RepID=A0A4S5BMC4_9BURK|nr:benzoate/H(+) symporter BenE family transporter [Lampropedia aestuarii]MDH5858378.1 benzoate/H(+) symporter BenE family transporter [Lampropedia aestuarii]THJ32025.1 benzoate/H(+) symporter BenE family transporter [Lampropedia aestuarii]